MILCIGERVNNRHIPSHKVERWADAWLNGTIHGKITGVGAMDFIRMTPAMTRGTSMSRLMSVLGTSREEVKIINLLSPDNKIGTWNIELAMHTASKIVRPWMEEQLGIDDHVFLMGRRVCDAFGWPHAQWGAVTHLESTNENDQRPRSTFPCMALPHPSPRNRVWNDRDVMDDLTEKVSAFLAEKKVES